MSPIPDSHLDVWIASSLDSTAVVTERQKRCALERLYQSAAQQTILPPVPPMTVGSPVEARPVPRRQPVHFWRVLWRGLTLIVLDEKGFVNARKAHSRRYYTYSKLTSSLAWIPAGLAV